MVDTENTAGSPIQDSKGKLEGLDIKCKNTKCVTVSLNGCA